MDNGTDKQKVNILKLARKRVREIALAKLRQFHTSLRMWPVALRCCIRQYRRYLRSFSVIFFINVMHIRYGVLWRAFLYFSIIIEGCASYGCTCLLARGAVIVYFLLFSRRVREREEEREKENWIRNALVRDSRWNESRCLFQFFYFLVMCAAYYILSLCMYTAWFLVFLHSQRFRIVFRFAFGLKALILKFYGKFAYAAYNCSLMSLSLKAELST